QVCWSLSAPACTGSFSAMATTAPGATSYSITGLVPASTYYVVVRAKDQTGNVDANTVERSATTPSDTTVPTFGGATSAVPVAPDKVQVGWSAASDDVTPASGLTYLVCVSTTTGSCASSFVATATTAAGATSSTLTGLVPSS